MFKRVALFLATNLAVLVLLGIVMAVLQRIRHPLGSQAGLLVMAAVFGFGGSFISLLISKWMAKRSTGAHVIEQPRNETEQWLVDTVRRQAEAAGIGMPEVAIYDAPEINAFATGANRNNALVAVSTGLLRAMNRDEAEAVLGHEVSHVANGDMVTMALIQGVLNTFVIVLSRVVGRVIDGYHQRQPRGRRGHRLLRHRVRAGHGVRPVRQHDRDVVLASPRVPRRRRRRPLAGRDKMVAALQRLSQTYGAQHAAEAGRRPSASAARVGHGLRTPVDEPSAAGGAHRSAAQAGSGREHVRARDDPREEKPADRRAFLFAASSLLELVVHVGPGGGKEVALHVVDAAREQRRSCCRRPARTRRWSACPVRAPWRRISRTLCLVARGSGARSWMKPRSILSSAGSKWLQQLERVEAGAELLQAHAAAELRDARLELPARRAGG